METRLACGDQWKAEKFGAFWRWPITRCFIKSDRAWLIINHSTSFRLNGEHWRAVHWLYDCSWTKNFETAKPIQTPSVTWLPSSKFQWLLNQRGLYLYQSYSTICILARLWESKRAYAIPLGRNLNYASEFAFVIEFASSSSPASVIRLTYVNLKKQTFIHQHEKFYREVSHEASRQFWHCKWSWIANFQQWKHL